MRRRLSTRSFTAGARRAPLLLASRDGGVPAVGDMLGELAQLGADAADGERYDRGIARRDRVLEHAGELADLRTLETVPKAADARRYPGTASPWDAGQHTTRGPPRSTAHRQHSSDTLAAVWFGVWGN